MNWQKLDKESIETLKITSSEDVFILVSSDKATRDPYDIILFLDLTDIGYTEEEMENHWHSMQNECVYNTCNRSYEYSDEILLDLFSHFCIITKPSSGSLRKKNRAI